MFSFFSATLIWLNYLSNDGIKLKFTWTDLLFFIFKFYRKIPVLALLEHNNNNNNITLYNIHYHTLAKNITSYIHGSTMYIYTEI